VWQGTGVRWLLFLLIPAIDLVLLIQAARRFGGLWVAGFVIASALVGRWLARRNGRRFLALLTGGARPAEGSGSVPDLVTGGLVGAAGILFMIPGPLSTLLGLVLLLRPVRRWMSRFLAGWVERRMVAFGVGAGMGQGIGVDPGGPSMRPVGQAEGSGAPRGAVIDVDGVEIPSERKPS
jgi:UPF0716 protein FxsA